MTILSFADDRTASIYQGRVPRGVQRTIAKAAQRRLMMIEMATSTAELGSLGGNRLHRLSGDRSGLWSIRVNDRYRITFIWTDRGAEQVWFGDYH